MTFTKIAHIIGLRVERPVDGLILLSATQADGKSAQGGKR